MDEIIVLAALLQSQDRFSGEVIACLTGGDRLTVRDMDEIIVLPALLLSQGQTNDRRPTSISNFALMSCTLHCTLDIELSSSATRFSLMVSRSAVRPQLPGRS